MDKLLNQLILIAGAWSETEDKVIEQQFSILFEELKQLTGLNHAAAEGLLHRHISGEMAA
ncbi:hypothetical protein B481_2021 [Planococcus halocryophilus Or1]|uniref:Uncharacterized protein n=1 Tax=Planococcus halocryophilus TaxID=1215089 RepID=A0A1C7DPR5_9BACL|nr:hypothetical protein [Planococcus halocryophilus]ANU13486.1 hypothetical protein BBI08_06365 [Planococcus halocryophilus]EMF46294.1 hypothetical protein B481_2021 [Planococcus halocryophilus Or1]